LARGGKLWRYAWPYFFFVDWFRPWQGCGEVLLFAAVIKQGGAFVILALVAIINSVISLYYYARIVKLCFLIFPSPFTYRRRDTDKLYLLGVLTTVTILFSIYFGPLLQYSNESLKFFVK
jgi:NADH-quinone oxidoreductase subunit N